MLEKRSPIKITKAVLFALILREVQGKFGRNRLGAFWFVFEPIAHISILLIIFVAIRQRMIPGIEYAVFLVHGVVPFILFKNISLKGMEAVNSNKGLFSYRQIKPFDMIVARAVVEILLMACVYIVILFCLGWFFGYDVLINKPLEWMMILVVGLSLSFGLALIYCVIVTIIPEASTLIRLMYMPLYLMTGVIFPIKLIPAHFLEYLLWNPYLHIIELLRAESIAHYSALAQVNMEYPAYCAVIILALSMWLYRKKRFQVVAT